MTSLVTGERIKLVSDEIRVSAITLAELLRLGQAARAVRDGRPGAVDKLDLVLSEAPEPISRYRPRAPKGFSEWATLATLILMLVQTLVPILKQDGSVSEQELINIIERLVDQLEAGKLKDSAEDQHGPSGERDASVEPGVEGSVDPARQRPAQPPNSGTQAEDASGQQ